MSHYKIISASGDELREKTPMEAWLSFSFHLVGLEDGVLKIAPLYDAEENHLRVLTQALDECGFVVKDVDLQIWDREKLYLELQQDYHLVFDRAYKMLANLIDDPKDEQSSELFVDSVIKEAIRFGSNKILFILNEDDKTQITEPSNIAYLLEKGSKEVAYVMPQAIMKAIFKTLYKLSTNDGKNEDGLVEYSFSFVWFQTTHAIKIIEKKLDNNKKEITLTIQN